MRRPNLKHRILAALSSIFFSLFLTYLVLVEPGSALDAPDAPGHNISFQTVGLPAGITVTIDGVRVNNGGNPSAYTMIFNSPGPSANVGADPGSVFTYAGFPITPTAGNQGYLLVDLTPTSPFTVGVPGGSTAVIATYTAVCFLPTIINDPLSQIVDYGSPVTFTLSASGTGPLSYQWYKDNILIPGADQASYTIPFVQVSDAGLYHAEVSNSCGTSASSPAVLTVNKADQVITFTQPPSPAVFGTTFVVTPTASSGLPVTLNSAGTCTNNGFLVTMTGGTGLCVLTASQPGDNNYNPAPDVTRWVDAAKADQVIDFPQPPSPAAYGTTFTVSLTASSGLPVGLSSAGGCTNVGNSVTMTSGTTACTLTAFQPGDNNYNPAQDVVRMVDAVKADQVIDFPSPPSPQPYGAVFTVNATASSGLPVEITASGSCTNSGPEVTITASSGTCTMTAAQAGDENYNPAATVTRTVEAVKADQSILFPPPASPAVFGSTFNLVASASSGLPVSFAVSGVCSLTGITVAMTSGTGICTITATQQGDLNYNPAAPVQREVAAAKANQAISFPPPPSPVSYGSSFDVSPSSNSGLAVVLSAEGSCTSSGYTVTMVSGTGLCVMRASQAGDDNYLPAADVTRWVDAARIGQAITFAQPPSPATYQTSFDVAPTASSGLTVLLSGSGSCTVSGYTVTMTKPSGFCVLTAVQAGDLNYLPAIDVIRLVEAAPYGNIVFMPLLFNP